MDVTPEVITVSLLPVPVGSADNYVYWASVPIPPDPVEIVNTVPFQKPRPMPAEHSMTAIQATSYALLVYLLSNR